jgi:ribosomal protein S8
MAVLTDPISDFLTRFKNAARAGNETFTAPYSKIKADIAEILDIPVGTVKSRVFTAMRKLNEIWMRMQQES